MDRLGEQCPLIRPMVYLELCDFLSVEHVPDHDVAVVATSDHLVEEAVVQRGRHYPGGRH